jgi:hypothetical protein
MEAIEATRKITRLRTQPDERWARFYGDGTGHVVIQRCPGAAIAIKNSFLPDSGGPMRVAKYDGARPIDTRDGASAILNLLRNGTQVRRSNRLLQRIPNPQRHYEQHGGEKQRHPGQR